VEHRWPAVDYETWSATCDALHAHTQVLGKFAVALAPPEPELTLETYGHVIDELDEAPRLEAEVAIRQARSLLVPSQAVGA
jgi:hypothetical protein